MVENYLLSSFDEQPEISMLSREITVVLIAPAVAPLYFGLS